MHKFDSYQPDYQETSEKLNHLLLNRFFTRTVANKEQSLLSLIQDCFKCSFERRKLMKIKKLITLVLFFTGAVFTTVSHAGAAKVSFHNPPDARPNQPFSEAVRVDNLLILSGKLGIVPGTRKLAEGGIKGETKQAMENIKTALERYGATMNNVVKCTVFLADIKQWGEMNKVYVTYFKKHKPARSALGSSGLALNAAVEIECMAAL